MSPQGVLLLKGTLVGVVLRLVRNSTKQTIDALRQLLECAMRGEVVGLCICFKTKDGQEKAIFTGVYSDRQLAASAAMRMSVKMTMKEERIP